MRVFQIIHSYEPYVSSFEAAYRITDDSHTFEGHRQALINDRFYAAHILQPALNGTPDAFYTMWDYPGLQLKWARERGWIESDLKKILFAQIEEFKPDVFYNCSPIRFTASEIRSLGGPGMIKLAWYASPEQHSINFSVYHAKLTNYPPFVSNDSEPGVRSELFQPAYDPAMGAYSQSTERPIDILFYGQYTQNHFKRRNRLIKKLIELKKRSKWNIKIALQYIAAKKSVFPSFFPGRCQRWLTLIPFPSASVKRNTDKPLYGLNLYNAISRSKLVFNAATDMSSRYKVNMRNLESLGCGAHMLSEVGNYPDGLKMDRDFSTYRDFDDFVEKAKYFLDHPSESRGIAKQGHETVSQRFSKERQWQHFEQIVATL